MRKILVTGSGGIGGVNFVRALKLLSDKFFIVGTDFNKYYLQFAELDERIISPKHSDPNFITFLNQLVEKHKIEFLHPQPSSEALVVSQNLDKISTKTLLPLPNVISKDKLETQKILLRSGVLVAKTKVIDNYDVIENTFEEWTEKLPTSLSPHNELVGWGYNNKKLETMEKRLFDDIVEFFESPIFGEQ